MHMNNTHYDMMVGKNFVMVWQETSNDMPFIIHSIENDRVVASNEIKNSTTARETAIKITHQWAIRRQVPAVIPSYMLQGKGPYG